MIRAQKVVSVDPFDSLSPRLRNVLESLYPISFVRPGSPVDAELILPGGVGRVPAVPRFDASEATAAADGARVEIADDLAVAKPFRGMRTSDRAAVAAALTAARDERTLALGENGVLWAATEDGGTTSHRTAVLPDLSPDDGLRDAFGPGRTLSLLPLLSFADELTSPQAPPLPAAIVIDDPNLHATRYGFLDYERIVAESARTPLHVALAVIPLDLWHASRRVVHLLREHGTALSTLVHGNNHTRRELAQPLTDDQGLALVGQAVARAEAFARRRDVRVSHVMAPPHGAFARPMARRMVRVGFDALTISRAQPWLDTSDEHENRDPVSDARRVSVEAGLPIVRRTHVDRLETLPYSAFLRQPLVVYGHHWDWPGGAEAVAETAAAVARITDVEWLPMADVARWGSEVTRNGAQIALDVRSRQTLVEVPAGVTTLVVDPESIDPRDRLCVGGVGVDPGVPVEVSAGDSVSVTLSPSDAARPMLDDMLLRTSAAAGRRMLTESRDRLAPTVQKIRALRPGRGT